MKIGLVCPYNIGLGGGVQECVMATQVELKKRGHEAYIITPRSRAVRDNPPKNTILVGAGTDVRSPFSTTAQISASVNPEELERIIDEYRFDILHFHEPWVPMLSRQLLSKSKSINIATFHARMPDGVMTKTIEKVITPYTKSILKSFDALTAVSEPAAQYVRSLTDQSIKIIPNGVNLKKYRPLRAGKPSDKTILYIGRLERRKGVNHLIDAFARLGDADCRLLIAGNGPDREKLENQVRLRNLGNVEFLGYVEESEKIRLLREASVFCSPAIYGESFGIVLLEAMACGTPTVAANNPGYVSVMQGRGLISLIEPTDTDQFARRLALMLYDKELAALWRKWATNYVKQFEYATIVDQYESIYKQFVMQS
ncbi:glycosyltransferase family 4 protein [Candidatus Saccharibacteria bacterium]|nr:glycosyltransferase family 4 protein [Candidatus Saccharibacteria bacterium]